jgi:hypothetical protein
MDRARGRVEMSLSDRRVLRAGIRCASNRSIRFDNDVEQHL